MRALVGRAALAIAGGRFERLALGVLGYTVLVILWGAMVRITGSGAGCGQHWPTCHGEIVPTAESLETLIEFGHRLTSGLCLIVIFAMWAAAVRAFEPGHQARLAGRLGAIFVILESLIGAALVLLEYVAGNDSPWRAVWMAGHLANTFILTAVLLLAVWATRERPRFDVARLGAWWPKLLALCAGVLIVSMAGAVTALGDTLFPVDTATTTIWERIRGEQNGVTHFLMQLRIVHPALSTVVGLLLITMPLSLAADLGSPRVTRAARRVAALSLTQVGCGVANIWLSAPGWMQVLHLLLALVLWLSLVWLVWEAASARNDAAEVAA